MFSLEYLTCASNVLELKDTQAFLNTTTMRRSSYIPSNWCSDVPGESDTVLVDVKPSYFSGFVFRGDLRPPESIFQHGFLMQHDPSSSMERERQAMGAAGGITQNTGISTSICATACLRYSFQNTSRNPFAMSSVARAAESRAPPPGVRLSH